MASLPGVVSEELTEIEGRIGDILRALSNGFQKLEKIKDPNRRNRQLEELTDKMRDCKGLIKEFDRELKLGERMYSLDVTRTLNEKKHSMIKELNYYVALKKQMASSLENKRGDLLDGTGSEDDHNEENGMTNQQLIDSGHRMMDETDQAIARSKQVVQDTINVGADTAQTLKSQTEQMSRIVNELDTVRFSIKKANQLVKEIGRQVATDRIIVILLFIIVVGVIVICIVKLVNPNNKDIRDIPGLAPPAQTRKLLWYSN